MKSSKRAVAVVDEQLQSRAKWMSRNYVYFPQGLRDAIPGPELPGCDQCLLLSAIAGTSEVSMVGRRVRLNFRVEESGKLTGAFNVQVDLNVDAAKALAATLKQLVEQAENRP